MLSCGSRLALLWLEARALLGTTEQRNYNYANIRVYLILLIIQIDFTYKKRDLYSYLGLVIIIESEHHDI